MHWLKKWRSRFQLPSWKVIQTTLWRNGKDRMRKDFFVFKITHYHAKSSRSFSIFMALLALQGSFRNRSVFMKLRPCAASFTGYVLNTQRMILNTDRCMYSALIPLYIVRDLRDLSENLSSKIYVVCSTCWQRWRHERSQKKFPGDWESKYFRLQWLSVLQCFFRIYPSDPF